MIVPPFAVHISDGILYWPWLLLGFVAAALLLAVAARRIADDEIPRIALLTAAFFVSSVIRVPVGPATVHLLLNGLVGVILGWRAALAIAVGLLLQAILLGHGGFLSLGVNIVVISLPALLARPLFIYLLREDSHESFRFRDGLLAVAYVLNPPLMFAIIALIVIVRRFEWRWNDTADFRAGFFVGAFSVLLTAVLNATVLVVAGIEDWRIVAAVVVAAHIPIALVEGLIVGCTANFLRRVKPEMLGDKAV